MPAQVDFAEPQRVDSHLSGAWKESLIKDAGGSCNLTCIMPHTFFPSWSPCLQGEFSEIQKIDSQRGDQSATQTQGKGVLGGPPTPQKPQAVNTPEEIKWTHLTVGTTLEDFKVPFFFKQLKSEVSLEQDVKHFQEPAYFLM